MYFLVKNKQFFPVPHESLQEGAEYAADVQATVNPATFHAHWSDWGPNVKWKIKSQDYKAKEPYFILLLVSLPCLILCYCVKVGRLKKMCPRWYVVSPKDFFEPLYHTHQGDFKKWVGQRFTLCEFDFLEKSPDVQVLNRKQTGVPQGLCRSGCEVSGASRRLDASSALSPAHSSVQSTGHISSHTVTLSGDDSRCLGGSLGPYGSSQNSLTYPGCGLGGAEGPLDVGPEGEWVASGMGVAREYPLGLPAVSGSYIMEWQLVAGDNELERISLDSFSSAEHTEDGYPAMEPHQV
ncbi:hypothetical protein SKAU_G00288390 [Synaphobranchus kaupii]|uniref:Uncharacterized protein n=1 Tax=Synaphobranchus kaupii TaxID=118154 RepID=A0A9Q1ET77_SYNKA|nr:hypothetical protein SKAU_G00288390 [Synaphobranchus kaupii]